MGLLVRKLNSLGTLTAAEHRLLCDHPLVVRDVGPDQDLVREGDEPVHCLLLLEGFACRNKSLRDGRRQILAFNIPGDFVDLCSYLTQPMDHSISTLTQVKVGTIPHGTIADWTERFPNLCRLLWRDTLIDAAINREWMVNVGRRSAYQRIAHILCEMAVRLHAVGLAQDYSCDLPITQGELADATGLSTVHVNRVIQELRGDGLIALNGRSFTALDWEGLKRAADFDPLYLNQLAAARGHSGQVI
ncbi:MAG: Crp/Fnr family transcriptional regulator [Acetobacteraceae bacterium]